MVIRKNIEAILFDLDGTIFHLDVDWSGVRNKISERMGRDFESYDAMLGELKSPIMHEYATLLEEAEVHGVISGQETDFATDSLQGLSKLYKIAVVTRNSRKAAEEVINKLGLTDVIIVAREDVEHLKPHPEALEVALRVLGVGPAQVIVVGDTTHDVQAAHRLGTRCIIVHNQSLSFSPPEADLYIKNLQVLPAVLQQLNEVKE